MMDILYESRRIKDRLDECKTRAEVKRVTDEERPLVMEIAKASPEGKTQAIQIANKKLIVLKCMEGN